ncbi:LysR substrate-binding domain-containing protein [Streptomyces sp. NPDC005071]
MPERLSAREFLALVADEASFRELPSATRTCRTDGLGAHPIVCMPRGTGMRTVFDQACAAQSLKPTIALQASAADAIADLAARGLAVAILSDSMAARYRDRLTAHTIDDVDTPAVLALIWKSAHSPGIRELLAYCRQAFIKPDPT